MSDNIPRLILKFMQEGGEGGKPTTADQESWLAIEAGKDLQCNSETQAPL